MPKPTFHNLPPEKRERIVQLAIDEFAEHPYRQASLSRLVTRAGIAKGSIYQYFENKFDLYRWLVLDVLSRRKQEYMEQHAGPPGTGFYERIEYMIIAGTGFLLENPKLGRLGARMIEPTSDPELRELNNQLRALGAKQATDLVIAAQQTGEVRKDFDPEMVAHFLTGLLGWGMTDAMLAKLGIELHQLLLEPDLARKLSPEEHQRLAHEGVRFVRHGLSTGKEPEHVGAGRIPETFHKPAKSDTATAPAEQAPAEASAEQPSVAPGAVQTPESAD